jgi:DNA-binding phage protein
MGKKGEPLTVLGQLRQAVEADGRTQYAIAKAAGIKPELLYRFMSRDRDLRGATIAKLCLALGLHLAPITEANGNEGKGA